jgi:hypothetical protein
MLANFYGNVFVAAFIGEIDFNSGNVKVMLLDNTHVPNLDTHNNVDDVVADEVVGTGYTAGGAALGTPTATYDGGTNTFKLDGDNVVWDPSTIAAAFAVIYLDTGTDSTSPLIALVEFEEVIDSTDGIFSITWDPAGICTVTVN